jgi:hypothetical protein
MDREEGFTSCRIQTGWLWFWTNWWWIQGIVIGCGITNCVAAAFPA